MLLNSCASVWRNVKKTKIFKIVLEKEELNKIIEKIENENPKEKAFFGIHSTENGDEVYIKANKSGLELFAVELLKASRKSNEIIENSEKNIIPLNSEEKWLTGDIWIGYIEPKLEDRIDLKEEPYKKTWKDKIVEYGCFTIIGIGILIFIAGIFAIISSFK